MSVDLEDYYIRSPFNEWDQFESRVTKFTKILLELFKQYKVTATFFTLGYLAKRHPELIEEVISQGHEVASHSYAHKEVKNMTREDFEDDLVKSINIIKHVTGESPKGFRAPRFSINKESFWAFTILKKYLTYDSSLFPINYTEYGIPDAPTSVYRMSKDNPLEEDDEGSFFELPLASLNLPGIGNLPIAGGFYFRFLPMAIINYGIRKLNKNNQCAVCYIHPHDLDSEKPHLQGYPWHVYWNLSRTKNKLESLLKNFEFSSVRDVLLKQ